MNTRAEYQRKIAEHVAAWHRPEVKSIAEDAHIFHFERSGDWMNAPIVFVNKNGNQFRLFQDETNGTWELVKHWEGQPTFWQFDDWKRSGLKRSCPMEVIRLAGTGPQGKNPNETLALLPKGTTNFRKAVWRGTILDVRFDVNIDKFTISENPLKSATFNGKLWLSTEAAAWCAANVGVSHVASSAHPGVQKQDEELMMELEGSDMWGMF